MNGFLLDKNLPYHVAFTASLPIIHVSRIGKSPTDSKIWKYAKQNNLVIVTKDADFSNRIIVSKPPPKIIHLRFGNLNKRHFHQFLKKIWPQIEESIKNHKLVNVYLSCLECIE